MQPAASRTGWIDHLRGFITLLVVAHHAALAYTSFGYFNKDAYILSTHPVVDRMRWVGLDFLVVFNDTFFMCLMFFISGIFVFPGLQKKGISRFVKDRFYRLFIPFVIGVTLLMLLAYYPAYYQAYGQHDLKGYLVDFFTTEAWPVGPPWFIWVLFLFNLAAAIFFKGIKILVSKITPVIAWLKLHPAITILCIIVITWILYVPVLFFVGADRWTGIGPFDFQISRMLLYFGYFMMGILIGGAGIEKGILETDSRFLKRWPVWLSAGIVAFVLLLFTQLSMSRYIESKGLDPVWMILYYGTLFICCCSLVCAFCLGLFQRRFNKSTPFRHSLAANAYGIYLLHYIFVVWIQFLLMPFQWHALIKFLVTLVAAIIFSWALTALLRKIRIIGKYI